MLQLSICGIKNHNFITSTNNAPKLNIFITDLTNFLYKTKDLKEEKNEI